MFFLIEILNSNVFSSKRDVAFLMPCGVRRHERSKNSAEFYACIQKSNVEWPLFGFDDDFKLRSLLPNLCRNLELAEFLDRLLKLNVC